MYSGLQQAGIQERVVVVVTKIGAARGSLFCRTRNEAATATITMVNPDGSGWNEERNGAGEPGYYISGIIMVLGVGGDGHWGRESQRERETERQRARDKKKKRTRARQRLKS